MADKDAQISELQQKLVEQEEAWEARLAQESEHIQQQFLAIHEQSMQELEVGKQHELAHVRETAELWEARANAAAEALHTLEEQTDERDRIAHEKMRQAFAEVHEKDMEELCNELIVVRGEMKELKGKFADRLEEETSSVVEEAVRSAVEAVETRHAQELQARTAIILKLQQALAAALSQLPPASTTS
eukprot:INCI19037.1.p1 GENE.INCI19037.1~~INCI19037.1.p1  ORF type:complete len:188 (-),score=53.50 INCI19037.1:127-690(-)